MTDFSWVKGRYQGCRPMIQPEGKRPCYRVTVSGRSLFTNYEDFARQDLPELLRPGVEVALAIDQLNDGTYWLLALSAPGLTLMPNKEPANRNQGPWLLLDLVMFIGGILLIVSGFTLLGPAVIFSSILNFHSDIKKSEDMDAEARLAIAVGRLFDGSQPAIPIEDVIDYLPPDPSSFPEIPPAMAEPTPDPADSADQPQCRPGSEEESETPPRPSSEPVFTGDQPFRGEVRPAGDPSNAGSAQGSSSRVGFTGELAVGPADADKDDGKRVKPGFFHSLALSQQMAWRAEAGEADVRLMYDRLANGQPEEESETVAGPPTETGDGRPDGTLGILDSLAFSQEMTSRVRAGETDVRQVYTEMLAQTCPQPEPATGDTPRRAIVLEGSAKGVWVKTHRGHRRMVHIEYGFTCRGQQVVCFPGQGSSRNPLVSGEHPFYLAESDLVRIYVDDDGRTVTALRNLEDGCAYFFGSSRHNPLV